MHMKIGWDRVPSAPSSTWFNAIFNQNKPQNYRDKILKFTKYNSHNNFNHLLIKLNLVKKKIKQKKTKQIRSKSILQTRIM